MTAYLITAPGWRVECEILAESWKSCTRAASSPHPRGCSEWDVGTPGPLAKFPMGAQALSAPMQSQYPCTEGSAGSSRGSALHRGPVCLEGVRATLGLSLLASGSRGSTVVRQEVEWGQVNCSTDLEHRCDTFWHFPDLNFKYFWVLYFAPACCHTAAPSVDEILSTRML